MALVTYSDSEDSEMEDVKPSAPSVVNTKRIDRSEVGRIKIDLPALRAESIGEEFTEPSAKRQRTSGAFSGFNSMLPAPKRSAQGSIKPGINLRTSSEAAFSRTQPQALIDSEPGPDAIRESNPLASDPSVVTKEPVLVGKPTRFLPLSVANAKKKKKKAVSEDSKVIDLSTNVPSQGNQSVRPQKDAQDQAFNTDFRLVDPPKPKQSLFSIEAKQDCSDQINTGTYEPEFIVPSGNSDTVISENDHFASSANGSSHPVADQHALQQVASDLNLSNAERRRLFGRGAKDADIKISHFNMDSEYRANQGLAANGELAEHRAVKAIAPGKHSLQQLVNNARGQSDAFEDKWAEGRKKRGESGSKYGWT